ncbi:alpha-L-rhamnosidase N-terminal domain-containing protein [Paenibacillus sp. PAMC21692]|uniref:alpha-L-rhamnosidase-related protein n=1 Tax=Paenibacillus sp. PAMC21692 TaxID=2762320 RepID=UPI00164D227F|nr:family 78 glycoside hydrolase catalytic domain [Paenibacillus sp. PAMC21692]QNK57954.1 alpha-L-rhamnosidase N-terminal domain-containing protein [Paenibacillus sp. PAMC21692]
MKWLGQWIWAGQDDRPVNERVCFRKSFQLEETDDSAKAKLHITADSRYRLWFNGNLLGEGPIRSSTAHWYFDTYDVSHLLQKGDNLIAIEVWHFGHSNYQYIEARAGLLAQLEIHRRFDTVLIGSDKSWKAMKNEGYRKHTVKRNVNLGWMEHYDARDWDEKWINLAFDDAEWPLTAAIGSAGMLPWGLPRPRDIPLMSSWEQHPSQIVELREVVPVKRVVTVNARDNFYPDARDANARVFSGFLVTAIEVSESISGRIAFPSHKWNGVYGDVIIGGVRYALDDSNREFVIDLSIGFHLMMIEICGVHDDLFCHILFDFPIRVKLAHPLLPPDSAGDTVFVTLGPIEQTIPVADGVQPVYGGVEDSGLNRAHHRLKEIATCRNVKAFSKYVNETQDVPSFNVMDDEYVFALLTSKTILKRRPLLWSDGRMLRAPGEALRIKASDPGVDLELIIDFGEITIGNVAFEVEAEPGVTIDGYGFESMVRGEMEFTEGLNNSFRYVTKAGVQPYRTATRFGFRYLMLTFRGLRNDVSLREVRVCRTSFPVSEEGKFRCSDLMLNEIWTISRRTHLLCMEDTFTDCPTYEQVFWVGDSRISALSNYSVYGSYDLVRHCLELVPRSGERSPLLAALYPTDWEAAIPFWTFSWVIACREYVMYSGDTAFEETNYPQLKKIVQAYLAFVNEKGLFDISAWNFLDWAKLDVPYAGTVTAYQAMLAYCCKLVGQMAGDRGEEADKQAFDAQYCRLKTSLREHLWDAEAGSYFDGLDRQGGVSKTRSMQTHLLVYLSDCVTEDISDIVAQRLLDTPGEWVNVATPFMAFYYCEAMRKLDRLDRALAMIRKQWGGMVRYGATTCWETFPHALPNRLTRSHAHSWSASPAYLFGTTLLGIEMETSGFNAIRVCPPDTDLEWAEGAIPTPHGRIESYWNKADKAMEVRLPDSILVTVKDNVGWDIRIYRTN